MLHGGHRNRHVKEGVDLTWQQPLYSEYIYLYLFPFLNNLNGEANETKHLSDSVTCLTGLRVTSCGAQVDVDSKKKCLRSDSFTLFIRINFLF